MATVAPDQIDTQQAPQLGSSNSATLKSLNAYVDTIEARLRRIDVTTRQQVDTLDAGLKVLESKLSTNRSVQYKELSDRFDALSKTLTERLGVTQAEVTSGLARAMENPTLTNLKFALDRADARLTECETHQTGAIAKMNRHIADMASAIEGQFDKINTRLTDESRLREEASSVMKRTQQSSEARMALRLSEVEAESAGAINAMSSKVIDLSRDMQDKAISSEKLIKNHVSEITATTKQEFSTMQHGLEKRIHDVDTARSALDLRMGQGLAALTSRVESLEYGLSSKPQEVTPATLPAGPVTQPPGPEPVINQAVDAMPTPLAPLPEPVMPVYHETAPVIKTPSPTPQPFMPQAYTPDATPYQPIVPESTYAPLEQNLQPLPPAGQPLNGTVPTPYTNVGTVPASMTNLPYANPAYAESDFDDINRLVEGSLETSRPGGVFKRKKPKKIKKARVKKTRSVASKKSRKSKQPQPYIANKPANTNMSKGTLALRAGTVLLGVGVIGYAVSQNVLKDKSNLSVQNVQPEQILAANSSAIVTQPAIGQYADNQVNAFAATANSLEEAAREGNAVAQLQLGLAWLETGKTKEGISMIRASANQGQPAALYRLAKLYENGEGLTADSETARKLTERAARGGNRIAMHDLGLYYAEGRGKVKMDMDVAAKWFEKAAQRGVVDSQYNLAILSESGQGMPTNIETALVWYSIAGKQGDQMAEQRSSVLRTQLSAAAVAKVDDRIAKYKPVMIDEAANGIFRNTPWASAVQSVSNSNPRTAIKHTQTLLGGLGYNVGSPDGAMGPKTRSAIIEFERTSGLPETGRVNVELIQRLELAAGV